MCISSDPVSQDSSPAFLSTFSRRLFVPGTCLPRYHKFYYNFLFIFFIAAYGSFTFPRYPTARRPCRMTLFSIKGWRDKIRHFHLQQGFVYFVLTDKLRISAAHQLQICLYQPDFMAYLKPSGCPPFTLSLKKSTICIIIAATSRSPFSSAFIRMVSSVL